MILRTLPFALSLVALAGCGGGSNFRLYPLAGPIAQANPAKVIQVSVRDSSATSGEISFRLPKPNKTKCTGTWTSVAPKEISHERGFSLGLRNIGGKIGNTVTDVGGVNSGEIYAVCADGTRVQGTFVMGSGTQSGTGTASDTQGNRYKFLF